MQGFKEFISEGVNDPSIFKAIFLAGGPGSGKSFVVKKTALSSMGFKIVNSDKAFERALSSANLEMNPENIFSPLGQELRKGAKLLTKKQMKLILDNRLGIVIDGTGRDYYAIEHQAKSLEYFGYETLMIFVNSDLETALERNRKRSRSLPDNEVDKMWKSVQKNIGKFQNLFKQNMIIIDNSEGSNAKSATDKAYKRILRWSKIPPSSPIAKEWIRSQRNIQENTCPIITKKHMDSFEIIVDRLFDKFGINFEFTKHFRERMSDGRNIPCIDMQELGMMIKNIYRKKKAGKSILSSHANTEAVLRDIQSDLNIPVAIEYDRKNDDLVVVAKTIMRKKNFKTRNKIIKV